MATRTPLPIIRIILALTAACFLPTPLHAGPNGSDRPIKGTATGQVTGVAPSGALIVQTSGTATHLGRFTRSELTFIDGFDLSGTLIFTAANGDQLFAEFEGAFTSPSTAEGTYAFTGGTGRFTDATGSATFDATTTPTPEGGLNVAVSFSGTIDY